VLPKFLPAMGLIWILVPAVLVRCMGKLFVPYLQSQNHVGIASVAVVLGMLVNLGVQVGLMPVMGVPAAALGVLANYAVSTTVLAAAFHRVSRMGLAETWVPRGSDVAFLRQAVAGVLARFRRRAAVE